MFLTLMMLPLAAGANEPVPIADLNQPFLFSYLGWENKVRTENGQAVLCGIGSDGGAGMNVDLNLGKYPDWCPTLSVTVHPDNRAKSIRLLLKGDGQQGSWWNFPLPANPGPAVLQPADGATLARPNEAVKEGPLEISQVKQWQLGGDWTPNAPLSVTVTAISVAPPTETAKRGQAESARRAAAERQRKEQERADLEKRYGQRGPDSPRVARVSAAGPDVLALTVETGRITPGKLEDYKAQPGDKQEETDGKTYLNRGGQRVGWLIGPKKDGLVHFERFAGDPLLDFRADDPASYSLNSNDDPNFTSPVRPAAVYRKSKPIDWVQPVGEFVMRHELYLKLAQPLQVGKTYRVQFVTLNTREPEVSFTFDPATTRSDSVHVCQVGFRPDDPVKEARLSAWLGTGGGYEFPAGLNFRLVEEVSGRSAFTGSVETHWPAGKPERMARPENFVKTPVYRMRFDDFHTPGRYRVVVEGVGCSYPFEIGEQVWDRAFVAQMRGLLNNRSGLELGPPVTEFRKPRDFHPADGVPIIRSRYSVPPGASEHDLQQGLVKGATGETAPEAWGGYHDAGDWQPRRATHLRVTAAALDILELFPERIGKLDWPLPEAGAAPAALREALWELDLFRRLQRPDGGIPYGIETPGDPAEGEVSWKQSMTAYVAAPDVWSSAIYAGCAARAARLLAPFEPKLAEQYRESALQAMNWAEAEWRKLEADGKASGIHWEARDDRNLAALALYELTNDPAWHDVFKSTSCLTEPDPNLFVWSKHVQITAAFGYARLPKERADRGMQAKAIAGIEKLARSALNYSDGNSFGIAHHDPNRPMFLGFFSTPMAGPVLCQAHALTGKPEYLSGAVRAAQYSLGGNPLNLCYTTGLGANPVRNPLKLDARRTGQPAPVGLTVYGNVDYWAWKGGFWDWPITYFLNRACTPDPYAWPLHEAFFDIFLYPAMAEYTVDIWAPNVFTWGYLAARR